MSDYENLSKVLSEGNEQDIKEAIREVVRENIKEQSNPQSEEELSESVELVFGSLMALGGAWGWLKMTLRRVQNEKLLAKFIELHDPQNIISKKLPEIIRRFKLVNSLTDLEAMEKTVDQYLNQLDSMVNRVDSFVDEVHRDEKNLGDKVFVRNPQKEKMKIKKFIKSFISETKKTFDREVEMKKDELLS